MSTENASTFRDTNSPAVMFFLDSDERRSFSSLTKAVRHVMLDIPGGRRVRARIENAGSSIGVFEIAALAWTMNIAWD